MFVNRKRQPKSLTPAEQLSAGKKPRGSRHFTATHCRCREIRHELGLTIRDVAAATGISNPCICDVERGAETTISTARKLAKFYGKTIDWLWPEVVEAANREERGQ